MKTAEDYHKRPEWSYSQMKVILDEGIDYAVAAKKGMLSEPASPQIDLGQLVHMIILGGEDTFVLMEDAGFENFRTKAAQQWKKEMEEQGKNIITRKQWESVQQIVENIELHPHTAKYLKNEKAKHEIELYAKADGVDLRGKADALIIDGSSLTLFDLKTTAKFNKFMSSARYNHYDLQAAVYTLIGSASQGISSGFTNYYFCVAETVAPYRVQYFHANAEMVEAGERKLRRCIDAIKEFGDKEPTFMLTDIPEIMDYSL